MKSVRIPAKVAREARALLGNIIETEAGQKHAPRITGLLRQLEAASKPKKFVVAAKKRVKAKKAERQDAWAQIREKVLERADVHCEGCGSHSYGLECDHMFGGASRKTLQSAFTVWALCSACHFQKTNNAPDASFWLLRFIEHCADQASKYGDMAEDEPNGYARATDIAKTKLESRQIQGRAK